jgi:hypothetical protein
MATSRRASGSAELARHPKIEICVPEIGRFGAGCGFVKKRDAAANSRRIGGKLDLER